MHKDLMIYMNLWRISTRLKTITIARPCIHIEKYQKSTKLKKETLIMIIVKYFIISLANSTH